VPGVTELEEEIFMAKHVALFNGADSSSDNGLWETTGTVAGTTEIGGVGDAGVSGAFNSGLNPSSLTTFGGEELFQGTDSSGDPGLWETNGTAAGTTEIGGVNDAGVVGAWSGGLAPSFLTVLGAEVIFGGFDADDHPGLWATNGTAAGTFEIGGLGDASVSGTSGAGLSPFNMVALGNKVLFEGMDSNLFFGLWETDGTAEGTTEIGGLSDTGVIGASGIRLEPSSMVALGNEVLFNGTDTADHFGLWETDGTAAGTTEIGGPSDGGVGGAGSTGLKPSNMVALGNEVLFEGADSAGNFGLWKTDGAAAGTTEIGGLSDAGVSGAGSTGLHPSSMVALGNEVLFNGTDSAGHSGLWKTDGTAAGTTEIGGLGDAGISGAASTGLEPESMGVFGGEVLFNGADSAGNIGLWETNGTAAGTTEIGGLGNAGVSGASSTGFRPGDMTALGKTVTPEDFIGNAVSDVLLQNGGSVVDWLMQNGQYSSGNVLTTGASGWSVVGAGDFTGSGVSDALLQNGGTVVDWLMQNGQYSSGNVLTLKPPAGQLSVREISPAVERVTCCCKTAARWSIGS
jgi:hypothetical protein